MKDLQLELKTLQFKEEIGKKRLNPETGKPFKKGDVLQDGVIFHSYRTGDGHNGELWLTPYKKSK